ncbi:MAG: MFS transporter [Firmicutes bacterium]|nr:MFS transporter [Bacillota bacterium]MBO2520742.1 MFS transporter [Bacillota bacterium]
MLLPFAILAAVPFVMVLGNSMLIPVFPLLERELSLSQFQVGLLVTAFSVPAGLVIPFAGALSDHIGRKRIIFPALLLYGAGGLLAGFASLWAERPFAWILAGRIVQGVGAGGTYQIALALAGDWFSGGELPKAVGILEAANGFGKLLSPIAGAALGLVAWHAPFFAYGLLALPIAGLVWLFVPESRPGRSRRSAREYLRALGSTLREKVGPLAAVYLAGTAGLFLLFGLLSFVSDELEAAFGLSGVVKGLALAIPVGVMALTSYTSGILLQRNKGWLLPAAAVGLGAAAAGLVALAFSGGLWALLAWSSLVGLGVGVKLPALNTLITGATDASERGLVTALYGTVRFFGVALGPPAFGLVQGAGRLLMFLSGAAVAAAALAAVLLLVRPRQLLEG